MLGLSTGLMYERYTSTTMDLKQATAGTAAGLRLWLKHNTGVDPDGAKWDDSSGRNNHAVQSDDLKKGTPSGGGLELNGTSDFYNLTDRIDISDAGGFCLAVVLTLDDTSNTNLSGNTIMSDSANELIKIDSNKRIRINTNDPSNVTTDLDFVGTPFQAVKTLILLNRIEGVTAEYLTFKNGTVLTIDTDTTSNEENSNGFQLDTIFSNGGTSEFLNATVFELAFWDRALTNQEIVDVNYYLKNIHGL